jgi:oligo-1,6-glucosidase
MLFQFELMGVDHSDGDKWRQRPIDLLEMKRIVERWQLGFAGRAWNSNYLMNHDQPRSVSRFGDDKRFRSESAKALLLLNLSLGGTPYIYQGEELGMANVAFPSISDYRDLDTTNYYHEALAAGISQAEAMKSIHYMSRDNARTPMQWNAGPNAGFSSGTPWIGVNPDYVSVNAEAEEADLCSTLHFARTIIKFRKDHPALVYGSFELLAREDRRLFAFVREGEGERLLVEVNMSGEAAGGVAPAGAATILVSNRVPTGTVGAAGTARAAGTAGGPAAEILEPWEARISALK